MRLGVGVRLSIMMFLQFFVWGAWYVTAPRYLGTIGFGGADFGWTYSVGPIAGILSPFFIGMIADRFFATERMLGVMHLLGAAAMFGATFLMQNPNRSPDLINLMFFAHMLCYFPTLSLTNTLALHNMDDAERQFPMIRVFGTIGWIAAGFGLGWLEWGSSINMFYLAASAALVLGLFSFTLPHTPPPQGGEAVSFRELAGLDAFVLLKQRAFLTFLVGSFLVCIPLAFYYQMAERAVAQAGLEDPPIKMAFGQISEIVFMVLMPLFFKRLGVKWMLLVGMGAWVARYALFAVGAPDGIAWMMIGGIVLHGICYDFFFVTGQIYTDKVAPAKIRGQAQGMLVLFTLGFGMLIGAQVAGSVEEANTPPEGVTLRNQAQEIGGRILELNQKIEPLDQTAAQPLQDQVAELKMQQDKLTLSWLESIQWKTIWMMPAIGVGIIMLFFAVLFNERADIENVTEDEVAESAVREEQP